jgi:arylsulfatase A-like enzyme
MKTRLLVFLSALPFTLLATTAGLLAQQQPPKPAAQRVIIFVWDGLRADQLTPEIAPNYFALARSGVIFADHHAVYPTFTMMNSASIATGTYPGAHGFYGNVVYAPSAKGRNAKGDIIEFSAPAFIEDFGVVEAVRNAYQGRLTLVPTMLQAAQAKGLTTVTVGKFGAAFIQDYNRGGIILDEDAAMPLSFATELQQAGYSLPRNSINAYEAEALKLSNDNGNPTAALPVQRLKDGQTPNPLDCTGALSRPGFAYLSNVFVNYILPHKQPHLTIFWSKEPDATNHAYGPGTCNSQDATRMNDEILGRVMEKLRQLGWDKSTDIIVTQDHNHSTVSGDVEHFPLRDIVDGDVGERNPRGYSASGFVRTAELLTRDGLKAYDGARCRDIPILSGIIANGEHLHPRREDQNGAVCGHGQKYTSQSYAVPNPPPAGAVVVAANAGSDYLFVPDRNADTVKAAVASLQSRMQFGAIFVSDRYGEIAGTLPMSLIKTETGEDGRAPDIIVSFSYDENVTVGGVAGITYASSVNRRGDHGSFSPTDTLISLMASGPDFRSGFYDPLPTANVDIAPTVAHLLGFGMPAAQGRVIEEALEGGPSVTDYTVSNKAYRSSIRTGLTVKLPTDLDSRAIDPKPSSYVVELRTKFLTRGGASYTYFDHAKATRE